MDQPFGMVVAIVAIGCATGLIGQAIDAFKSYLVLRAKRGSIDPTVQETLKEVRDEIARLQRSSNDVVLTFDATLQRLDTRLQHLEQRAIESGRPAATLPPPTRSSAAEEPVSLNAR